jgi:hypothetical protein
MLANFTETSVRLNPEVLSWAGLVDATDVLGDCGVVDGALELAGLAAAWFVDGRANRAIPRPAA